MPNQEVLGLCSAGDFFWCSCLCLLVTWTMERGQLPAWTQEKNLILKYCSIKLCFTEETEQFWEMKHRVGGCTCHDFKAHYECQGASAMWSWCEDTARPQNWRVQQLSAPHTGAQATWEKKMTIYSVNGLRNCVSTCKKLKLDPLLTSFTKVIRPKIIRIQENIKENLKWCWGCQWLPVNCIHKGHNS